MKPLHEKYKVNKKKLFSESCYNDTKHFVHYLDDLHKLYQFPKDRTFNEIRRDIYFDRCKDYMTDNSELILMYTQHKNELKEENKKFHDLFRTGKQKLYKVLQDFNIAEFNNVPYHFNIDITNGRLIEYDGNTKIFVCEDENNYYSYDWSGS